MSKKPADKAATKTKPAGAGLMSIVQMAGFGLATVSVLVMVAGMHDLGFIDLSHTLAVAVVPMLVLLLLSVAMYAYANSRIHAARFAAADEAVASLRELPEQRIGAAEVRIESHLGADYTATKAQNEVLKAKLDEIRREEDARIVSEVEALRQKNAELQDRISMWAVSSVDAAMSDERKSAA